MSRRILVFIPTFAERTALADLARDVRALGEGYQPLVIDDGSVPPVPLAHGALQVRLPANMGLGVCTHVAFAHAMRHSYDAIVRIDGDGQHRVRDIPRLVAALDSADFVVGVRLNHANSGVGGVGRRFLKAYFNALASAMTRGAVPPDANSGCFAANRKAMAVLNERSFERYPEPEMMISAVRAGLGVASVEIEQERRAQGRSTLGPIAALLMFFRFNVFAVGTLLRRRGPR